MKTKIFKSVLPLMAFLMAIGLAFATEEVNSFDDSLVVGYIHKNGCESRTVSCDISGSSPCLLFETGVNYQVYNDTLCSVGMYWP